MEISIIGAGYVGLVSGVCFADFGYRVNIIDKNAEKIASLKKGKVPIFEEGLEGLLAKNKDNINFSTKMADIKNSSVVFIAVGTPENPKTGEANLSYLFALPKEIAPFLKENAIVAIKSTVPPKTNAEFYKRVLEYTNKKFSQASNPEFLREGTGVKDFMNPDRVLVGASEEETILVLKKLYEPIIKNGAKFIATDVISAELAKYAANSFLATKVAFINEIAGIAKKLGANISDVSKIIGLDKRIGEKFLQAGPGFGGSCFPKDILALEHLFKKNRLKNNITGAVIKANRDRKEYIANQVKEILDGKLRGKTIATLGLAFKAGTDDIRSSPAIEIIELLLKKGAKIKAHDYKAIENAKEYFKNKIEFSNKPEGVIVGADLILILTEWPDYKNLNYAKYLRENENLKIFDARNLLKDAIKSERYFGL
jgi:UDPglucose 6-dehydrogenase